MTSLAKFLKTTTSSISFVRKSITNRESSEAEPATEESKKESSLPPKKKCRRDCYFNPKSIKDLKESLAAPRICIIKVQLNTK